MWFCLSIAIRAQNSPDPRDPLVTSTITFTIGIGGGTGRADPSVLQIVQPEYTSAARAAGLQGRVLVFASVDDEGKPSDVQVQYGLGLGLDERAVEAVKQWKFKPIPIPGNGKAITKGGTVAVDFRLPAAGPWRIRLPRYVQLTRYVAPDAGACGAGGRGFIDVKFGADGSAQPVKPVTLSDTLSHAVLDAMTSWRFQVSFPEGQPADSSAIYFECGAGGAMSVPAGVAGAGVIGPVPLFRPEPQYAEDARKVRLEGTVLLSIIVATDGSVKSTNVLKPLGLGLDERAIEAVSKWRFRPAMKDGRPIAIQAQVEVTFHFGESAAVKNFAVNADYGTLGFLGSVDRTDVGRQYVFRVHLRATFDKTPNPPINIVDRIQLSVMNLVANRRPSDGGPFEILFVSSQPVAVTFTNQGDSQNLPELEFKIDKDIAEKANHLGLVVSDGRLLWPIATELRDLSEAMIYFKAAGDGDPGAADALLAQALVLDRAGHPDEAAPLYELILRSQPNNAMAMNNLAFILTENGTDPDRALDLAKRAAQAQKDSPEMQDTLGWAYLKKNQPEQAITAFRTALQAQPDNGIFHYHLGMALLEIGERNAAIQELRAALADHPNPQDEPEIRKLLDKMTP